VKTYVVRAYSRANKGYVLKNKNIYDNMTFKKALLINVTQNINDNIRDPIDLSEYIRTPVPKTFHGLTPPSKELMMKKSRMS